MVEYVLRRVMQSLVVLVGVVLLTFLMFHALPGGPTRALLPGRPSAAVRAHFAQVNGLDKPVAVQFVDYLGRVLHGNLGYSYKDNQPVSTILAHDLPKSAILVGASLIISLAIALLAGTLQATRRNRWDDHALTGLAFFFYAMPDFFLALILIDFFAIRLHLVSTEGPQGAHWYAPFQDPTAMILPVATLSLTTVASFSRYIRSSTLDVLGMEYVRTARAKGLSRWQVIRRHTLRNASLPLITLLGLSLPELLGGAIIVEEVFNYPGIGLETFSSALNRDFSVQIGITIVLGAAVILGNLIADIAYAIADPRVRI